MSVKIAREMISEVKGLAPLRGFRNAPHDDIEALADVVSAPSSLAFCDRVREAEINPLLVHAPGDGVTMLDALIRIESEFQDED